MHKDGKRRYYMTAAPVTVLDERIQCCVHVLN